MMKNNLSKRTNAIGLCAVVAGLWCMAGLAQAPAAPQHFARPIALQPLAQQVRRLETALAYLGQPLLPADRERINEAVANPDDPAAVRQIEETLDRYALVRVEINPESRVKVEQGAARPELVEQGTRLFLVKVVNQAGVTAPLTVESPNSGRVYAGTWNGAPEPELKLTLKDAAERWADISLYDKPPMPKRLSGLGLEYQLLEVYSRDRGQRSALLSFHVGQGTQDIGFRNDILILFDALPARPVRLRIEDERGKPAVASLLVRDHVARVYPNPAKRLAPDFPFQPQIYRGDGDVIHLPDGRYRIEYTGGPEYITRTKEFTLELDAKGPQEIAVALERWIAPSRSGWYSGDHHVHAAGCAHYHNPTEGVQPDDMIKQILGEGLNVGSVLTWGPCYYYQKRFFSGGDHPLSRPTNIMHYDLEVSGFPSSHAGHLVLLGLKDQDYPGTKRLEDWPTWTLPILKWAKAQGAVAGYAHSGWGLQVKSDRLPNDEMPGFDGIGANEYIVAATQPDTVDFISAVDTPYVWELNIWYHTLNVGFRTRISGETDFPCIYDSRVGLGRTYAKLDGALTFPSYLDALRTGRSYVSDGRSHLMDFTANGVEAGRNGSELRVKAGETLRVSVKVAAYLDETPNPDLRRRPYDQAPYWDVERARIGTTRDVPVELVVNGEAVTRREVTADGQIRDVSFDVPIRKSSWIAVRILPSAHTNPIFAIVDGKPIRASRRSAEWCLAAVNQCWTQKAPQMSPADREAARKAYDQAREVYRRRIKESDVP
jgi:hypothetical protein